LGLPASWFWDVELESSDAEKDAEMIIDRVLVVGTLEGWRTIRACAPAVFKSRR